MAGGPGKGRVWPHLAGLALLLAVVVLAHLGLWASDDIPVEVKRRLTLLNALGWGVVILPAIGVWFWLKNR